jgi:hypothetical protein
MDDGCGRVQGVEEVPDLSPSLCMRTTLPMPTLELAPVLSGDVVSMQPRKPGAGLGKEGVVGWLGCVACHSIRPDGVVVMRLPR